MFLSPHPIGTLTAAPLRTTEVTSEGRIEEVQHRHGPWNRRGNAPVSPTPRLRRSASARAVSRHVHSRSTRQADTIGLPLNSPRAWWRLLVPVSLVLSLGASHAAAQSAAAASRQPPDSTVTKVVFEAIISTLTYSIASGVGDSSSRAWSIALPSGSSPVRWVQIDTELRRILRARPNRMSQRPMPGDRAPTSEVSSASYGRGRDAGGRPCSEVL